MLDAITSSFVRTKLISLPPPTNIFSLSVFRNAEHDLNQALGVTLPVRPEIIVQNSVTYIWSGPGSWLVLGTVEADLLAVRPYAAVTDQSDGRVVFAITGPNVRAALAKLLPIDLHETAFAVGRTALTLAGHINVQIWRETDDRFALACFRSFANALYDALTTACLEFES